MLKPILFILLFSFVLVSSFIEVVILDTNRGEIELEIDQDRSPITALNFLENVAEGLYDGTIFHKVDDAVIEGGGFDEYLKPRPTRDGILNEWYNGIPHAKGTVAMARIRGYPNSATNLFFINMDDNEQLNSPQPDGAGYAVFGKVIKGMKILEKIQRVKTEAKREFSHLPLDSIVIRSVKMKSTPPPKSTCDLKQEL